MSDCVDATNDRQDMASIKKNTVESYIGYLKFHVFNIVTY